MGSGLHNPKCVVVIYYCPGNLYMCTHMVRQMHGDKLIHTHIGLILFNILFVRITSDMLLFISFFLMQFFCLSTLSIKGTLPYGSDNFSNNIFTVILVHFSRWKAPLPLTPFLYLGGHPFLLYCVDVPGTWSSSLWGFL